MKPVIKKRSCQPPKLIANRYRVDRVVGQGGMATVYKVYDISTQQDLALKQLSKRDDRDKQRRLLELFEREYRTLAHLSHPRVVRVYDYGVDNDCPYYTMELLDGANLGELSPIPWRKACKLLIDVCSVLALIHSRRLVHRDITPANIRCTEDGLAKLIDFGAMIPMGPCTQLVGTAPFSAPEMVNKQSLDGRTDLYSLGASLYYTLTSSHAFPTRDFSQLRRRWRRKPSAPSAQVKDIPKALDALTLSLLHIDPQARPVNAAEVIERLSAIAEINVDEHLLVSQAYLARPTLVGREKPLFRMKKRLILAQQTQGSTLMLRGASGVGRSRFIDACVFEGRLMGATVLRSDASDAQFGDYGVIRSLIRQFVDNYPEVTPKDLSCLADALGLVLPEFFEAEQLSVPKVSDQYEQIRAQIQSQLCDWFVQLSQRRYLLIAVDDIHHIDEPSAAFLAYLSHHIDDQTIFIVVSAESGAHSIVERALDILVKNSTVIKLKMLTQNKTEALLGSVFGKGPNIEIVSHHIHRISEGNPRDILQLAQHLIDKKLIRYDAGAWLLPTQIDPSELPKSMTQALQIRAEILSSDARRLAEHMALIPEESFSFDDCLLLTEHREMHRLMTGLQELVAADVLKRENQQYTFRRRGWTKAFSLENQPNRKRECHRRLVDLFSYRGHHHLYVIRHLLAAGEKEQGVNQLIAFSEESLRLTGNDEKAFYSLIRSLPTGWCDIFTEAMELCEQQRRPKAQIYTLHIRLISLIRSHNLSDAQHISTLYQMLYQDSGLAIYQELDTNTNPVKRMKLSLKLANERYRNASEEERGLEPSEAIHHLVKTSVLASGIAVASCDYSFLTSIPSLEPYVSLSPSVDVIHKLLLALGQRISSRCELAIQAYQQIIEQIDRPDRCGLDESYHTHVKLGIKRGLGMIRASMGLKTALKDASDIEYHPVYEVNALQIRMLYYTWQGDIKKAADLRKSMELLQIQKQPLDFYQGAYQSREFVAYAIIDDLTSVKPILDGIAKMAAKHRAWIPIYLYAEGEYHRIRGDHVKATNKFKEALQLAEAGRHPNWADIAGAYLRTLLALEDRDQARERGKTFLEKAESKKLGFVTAYIKMPLAIAEAIGGDVDTAVAYSDSVIEHFTQIESTGINLGLAYETRARIAIYMKDQKNYQKYLGLCRAQFCERDNPALITRYENLLIDSYELSQGLYPNRRLLFQGTEENPIELENKVFEALNNCEGVDDRKQCILDLLLEYSHTRCGFLYTIQDDGIALAAQNGIRDPPNGMYETVRDFLDAELNVSKDVTATSMTMNSQIGFGTKFAMLTGKQYHPILLGHLIPNGFGITGIVVLLMEVEEDFRFPYDIVEIVSRLMSEFGLVNTLITAF